MRLVDSRSGTRLGLAIDYPPPKGYAQVGLNRSDLARLEAFIGAPEGERLTLNGPADEGGRLELAWNPQRNQLRVLLEPVTSWMWDPPFIDLRRPEIEEFLKAIRGLQSR